MHYILVIVVVLAACLVASSVPIDRSRQLVNHPSQHIESRVETPQHFKKRSVTKTKLAPALVIRKGEYPCGNKVCKLRPGDKPPCDICQYPI